MMPVNYSERAAIGAGFAKTEIVADGDTTIYYAGIPSRDDPSDDTDLAMWRVRRIVASKEGASQLIVETWAKGPWADRANLDYRYLT